MSPRFTLRIGDHLKTPAAKRFFNEQVFGVIAPQYDFITRVFSFWRDAAWKRALVAALPAAPAPLCLDLACGTGDLVFLLAGRYADANIVGLDITEAMLERARRRNRSPRISFVRQDMGHLDFAEESVDIITGGYALRNAPDLEIVIAEIHRVLKPGGVGAFVDFSKPAGRLAQRLEYYLLKVWTGFWGLVLQRNPEVYGYIAESLRLFPDREQLRRLFERTGFTVAWSRLYFFGVIETLVVRKTRSREQARL